MGSITSFLPIFVLVAVFLTVVFTELIKKLDKKNRLKGYRVWVPVLFSAFFSFLLWHGAFFAPREVWFWWAAIFGISSFFYETILRKIKESINEGVV